MLRLDKIMEINRTAGQKDREAILDGPTVVTWGELEAQTRRLVKHFAGKNYRRVLFLSANRHELVPLFAAFSTLGVSCTGVDYTASLSQKLHCARLVGADALVYSTAFAREAAWLRERLPMDGFCLDTDLQAFPAADALTVPASASRFEAIAFTSGTTGFPKAVHRTRSFDARRFADLTRRFGFDSGQVFLATLPFSHVSVLGWARLALNLGGKLVIAPVEDPQAMARDVVKRRVTALLATPAVLEALLAELQKGDRPGDLTFLVTGGKHFPRDLQRRAIAFFGPIVHEYYGTTETGVNALATSADLLAWPGSSGRLLDGSSVAILDRDKRPLPEGEVGRVAIRSYQNMDGYLNGPAADTVTLGGNAYLITADFGYLQGDRIFLVNRTFVEATRLGLYAIEDALRQVPGVRDVFAVSLSSRSVNVFVAGPDGVRARDVEKKLSSLAGGLPGVRLRATFVERLPYSLSGKVQVNELLGRNGEVVPAA